MRVSQLKLIVEELLKVKGDKRLIGKNWPRVFIDRNPDLKSVFTTP